MPYVKGSNALYDRQVNAADHGETGYRGALLKPHSPFESGWSGQIMCRHGIWVVHQPSKLDNRVRIPVPATFYCQIRQKTQVRDNYF